MGNDIVSWCDKLASTPAVGVRLNPIFIPSEEILSSMAPVLNELVDGERPTFNVESEDTFGAVFNTESGFRYNFDHASVGITFNHRMRAQTSSGGPPVMELISSPAPYTQLLDEAINKLSQAVSMLPAIKGREMTRAGIVSVTSIDIDDLPPGIKHLFGEIGRPLGGTVENFSATIATKVKATSSFVDRCVYTLAKPEQPKSLATVQLDWQRTYSTSKLITANTVLSLLREAESAALDYFERVAEGGLEDGVDGHS